MTKQARAKNKSIWLDLSIKSHGVCHLLIFLKVVNGLFPTWMNGMLWGFGQAINLASGCTCLTAFVDLIFKCHVTLPKNVAIWL